MSIWRREREAEEGQKGMNGKNKRLVTEIGLVIYGSSAQRKKRWTYEAKRGQTGDNRQTKSNTMERSKRRGVTLSCAECRRLKLKCSKVFPCTNCVKKGCAAICPQGSLTTGKGNRSVFYFFIFIFFLGLIYYLALSSQIPRFSMKKSTIFLPGSEYSKMPSQLPMPAVPTSLIPSSHKSCFR